MTLQPPPLPLNPYAAPASAPARPTEIGKVVGPVRFWIAIVSAIMIVAGTVPACAFALWDVESIVVSGIAFIVVAVVLLSLIFSRWLYLLATIPCAILVIVAGIFLAIYLNSWSPSDAQEPIGYGTIPCAAFMQLGWLPIVITGLKCRNARRDADARMDDASPPSESQPAANQSPFGTA